MPLHRSYVIPYRVPDLVCDNRTHPSPGLPHIERHFDIDCHASGYGIIVRDNDFPDRPPFYLSMPNTDMAEVDREIINRLRNDLFSALYGWQSPEDTRDVTIEDRLHRVGADDCMASLQQEAARNLEHRWYESRASNPTPARCSRSRSHPQRTYLTWMPYSNYRKCASCFADSDLKLMRVVVLRVLKYLNHTPPGRRHCAAELWRNYEQSLIRYGIAIALEYRRRGFTDRSLEILREHYYPGPDKKPRWIFWPELQMSH